MNFIIAICDSEIELLNPQGNKYYDKKLFTVYSHMFMFTYPYSNSHVLNPKPHFNVL